MSTFSIDLSEKYILTNGQTGPNTVLASTIKNDSLVFTPLDSGTGSDQLWYFTNTTSSNRFRLHTVQKGDFNAVDISAYTGENSIHPHFVAVEETTGQNWAVEKWSDGSAKIYNDFTGSDITLGVDGDNGMPGILGGDGTGNHWTLSKFEGTVQTVSASGTLATVIVPISTATSTATGSLAGSPTAPPTKAPDSGKTLGKGAIAGISVAGAFVVAVIIGGLIILWRRKTGRAGRRNVFTKADAMTSFPLVNRMN